MRICGFALTLVALLTVASPASAQAVTVSGGIKTSNLRFGGGRVVSENPVFVASGQITGDSGLYGRFWSTVGADENDTELDVGVGLLRPCLGGLRCRAEISYWVLPELDKTEGDLVNVAFEVSGTRHLGDGESVGFSARFEELMVLDRPDTQLFRINGSYTRPVNGVPVRLLVEYDYNRAKDWEHMPISVSAAFSPSWLPRGVSITPSLDVLVPLNHKEDRETGIALGVAVTRSW